MSHASSFVDVLRRRAECDPDRTAVRFVEPGATDTRSYAELDAAARIIASALGADARGDRAVLLFAPGLDYVAAFFGCLYAGVVAVPVYPPTDLKQLPRLQGILRDAEPSVLLTSAAFVPAVEHVVGDCATVRVLACDTLDNGFDGRDTWHAERDDIAFLQYTSGTTGTPKGVVVTHDNLLTNSEFIRTRFGHDRDSRGVIWLPPYHDMGLIGGILQPVYAGFEVTLMSPLSFLRDPGFWLRTMSDYGGTTSGGPNFAYDLCVRKVDAATRADLDLSGWSVAFTGAEQVRPDTLERFATTFAAMRVSTPRAFYPCYGLAEATLMVTGGYRGAGAVVRGYAGADLELGTANRSDLPSVRAMVGCGSPADGHLIRIVDGGQALPDGRVGEIWVSGASVTRGYWQRPDGPFGVLDGRSYLRTGDLGFLDGGELFVAGRIKDVIIIRGRNHAPEDLERTVSATDARLRDGRAAVFTTGDADDRLVVVSEVVKGVAAEESAALVSAVRRAVTEAHGLAVDTVALLAPGDLPTTSSGKVQRSLCRSLLESGSLEAIALDDGHPSAAPAREAVDLVAACRAAAAQVLEVAVDDIDVHRPLTDLGIDSVRAVELAFTLHRRAGYTVPLELVLSGADCSALAAAAIPATQPDHPSAADDALSENERAMWFLQRLAPDDRAYQLFRVVEIDGPLDDVALTAAWQRLVRRHESLRTCVEIRDGRPCRRRVGDATVLVHIDAHRWPDERVAEEVERAGREPVDLTSGPLWQLTHLDLGNDRHLLAVCTHHLVADLWSLLLLLNELIAALAGEPVPDAIAPSMRDVTAAERSYLATRADADLSVLRERLADAPVSTVLPTDRPRPAVRSHRGAEHEFALAAPIRSAVLDTASRHRVTPYAVLLAAFGWLVYRYTGTSDLVLGAPAPGRHDPHSRKVVGLCVNSMPIRVRVDRDQCFGAFVEDVGRRVRDALAVSRVPFARLVEELDPPREPGATPLFGTMVSLQQAPGGPALARLGSGSGHLRHGEFVVRGHHTRPRGAEFDLVVEAVDDGAELSCLLRYDCDLWDADSIVEFAQAWQHILVEATRDDAVTPHGVAAIGDEIVDGTYNAPERAPLALPDLAGLSDETVVLDAEQTAQRVGAVVAELRARGVGAGDVVAVLAGRSVDFVVAALAILRCGAAYLPLSLDDPPDRLRAQIALARPHVLCCVGAPAFAPEGLGVVDLGAVVAQPNTGVAARHSEGLAYVLFTSGTTGEPKGVCVPDAAIENLLRDMDERAPLPIGARCAWWTAPTFDVSAYEILSALRVGGDLRVVPEQARRTSAQLADWIATERIESAYVPPFALAALAARAELDLAGGAPLALRRLLVGVEPISHALLQRLVRAVPGLRVVNGYGPTETTVCATFFDVAPEPERLGITPIGRAVHQGTTYVLDTQLDPAPRGAYGELYVGGVPVAHGYAGRPALTAAAFLPDPFRTGGRMYRTGDIVRRDRDGELSFHGRRDQQVKLRGLRIELGEVEGALGSHPGVDAAAAAVREVNGHSVLVGYVVASDPADPPAPRDVLTHAGSVLPAAMVPGLVVLLDVLPATRHGKLDRSALPTPNRRPDTEPPRGELERTVAAVWAELFAGAGPIGRDDDFFALGGHSLLAEKCALEIGRRLGREVGVATVMTNPTPAGIAAALERNCGDDDAIELVPRPQAALVSTRGAP